MTAVLIIILLLLVVKSEFTDGSNWTYLGCFRDKPTRDLAGLEEVYHEDNSIDKCLSYCLESGYKFAGLQFRKECFCGDVYGEYGQMNETMCNMPCTGNNNEMCGGNWTNSVFSTGSKASMDPSSPQMTEEVTVSSGITNIHSVIIRGSQNTYSTGNSTAIETDSLSTYPKRSSQTSATTESTTSLTYQATISQIYATVESVFPSAHPPTLSQLSATIESAVPTAHPPTLSQMSTTIESAIPSAYPPTLLQMSATIESAAPSAHPPTLSQISAAIESAVPSAHPPTLSQISATIESAVPSAHPPTLSQMSATMESAITSAHPSTLSQMSATIESPIPSAHPSTLSRISATIESAIPSAHPSTLSQMSAAIESVIPSAHPPSLSKISATIESSVHSPTLSQISAFTESGDLSTYPITMSQIYATIESAIPMSKIPATIESVHLTTTSQISATPETASASTHPTKLSQTFVAVQSTNAPDNSKPLSSFNGTAAHQSTMWQNTSSTESVRPSAHPISTSQTTDSESTSSTYHRSITTTSTYSIATMKGNSSDGVRHYCRRPSCRCAKRQSETLDDKLLQIRDNLRLKSKQLGKQQRKLKCADDNRISTTVIGTFCLVPIIIFYVLILASDIRKMFYFWYQMRGKTATKQTQSHSTQ